MLQPRRTEAVEVDMEAVKGCGGVMKNYSYAWGQVPQTHTCRPTTCARLNTKSASYETILSMGIFYLRYLDVLPAAFSKQKLLQHQ